MRKRLDDLHPYSGVRLRVYYPGGHPPKVMTATGKYDENRKAYELRDFLTDQAEWVPSWFVASYLQ